MQSHRPRPMDGGGCVERRMGSTATDRQRPETTAAGHPSTASSNAHRGAAGGRATTPTRFRTRHASSDHLALARGSRSRLSPCCRPAECFRAFPLVLPASHRERHPRSAVSYRAPRRCCRQARRRSARPDLDRPRRRHPRRPRRFGRDQGSGRKSRLRNGSWSDTRRPSCTRPSKQPRCIGTGSSRPSLPPSNCHRRCRPPTRKRRHPHKSPRRKIRRRQGTCTSHREFSRIERRKAPRLHRACDHRAAHLRSAGRIRAPPAARRRSTGPCS
jgi:hypothetical protein